VVAVARIARAALVALVACGSLHSRFEIREADRSSFRVRFVAVDFRTESGLDATILPDAATDLVEVDVRHEVGSRDDPPGRAGLAHLVEHLRFAPTTGARLRQRALSVNARTNEDATHFMTLATADRFEEIVALEAERLARGCEGLTEAILDREREVVRNELRVRTHAPLPEGPIARALYPAGHPYAHAPGGVDAELDAITLADVCQFIDRHYGLGRVRLIVAGNVDPDAAKEVVGRHFVRIPLAETARAAVPAIEPPGGTVTIEADIDETILVAAWPAPPSYAPNGHLVPIAQSLLLDAIEKTDPFLGQVIEQSTWLSLGGEDAPFAAIAVTVADGSRVGWAKRRILEASPVVNADDASLAKLGTDAAVRLLARFEWLGGRTATYADWRQFREPGLGLTQELARRQSLDERAVSRMLDRTFARDQITWILVKPRPGRRGASSVPPALDPRPEEDLTPAEAPTVAPLEPPRRSVLAGARRFTADNGLDVVFLPTPSMIPLVTARLTFHAGSAYDPAGREGLATVAARQLHAEPATRNLATFSLLDRIHVDEETTTWEITGLEIHLEAILATLGALVENGNYQDLPRSVQSGAPLWRPRRLAAIAANDRLRQALFGAGHPYGRTGELLPETWDTMDAVELQRFRRRYFVARNATLVIAGPFDPNAGERWVKSYLTGFRAGEPADPIPPVAPQAAARVAIVDDKTDLVSVIMGWPAGPPSDPKHAARLVAARILERRFDVVREQLGASYGVHVEMVALRAGGAYLAGGDLDPLRAGDALLALRLALDEARRGERLEPDFLAARQLVLDGLLRRQSGSADLAQRLDWMAVHQRAPTAMDALVRGVARLTVDDVRAVLLADFGKEHEVITLVGPRAALERAVSVAGLRAVEWVGR
jgi:zinc protease